MSCMLVLGEEDKILSPDKWDLGERGGKIFFLTVEKEWKTRFLHPKSETRVKGRTTFLHPTNRTSEKGRSRFLFANSWSRGKWRTTLFRLTSGTRENK